MASSQSTVDYTVEQMSRGNEARARKMFGEYGVYCNGTFVGVICNDQLFLKITEAGKALLPGAEHSAPYDGAKPHLLVLEDAVRLSQVAATTADALPAPKPR